MTKTKKYAIIYKNIQFYGGILKMKKTEEDPNVLRLMKKGTMGTLRRIFGRVGLVFLSLGLQILLFAVITDILDEYSPLFAIFMLFFTFIMFFHLFKSDMDATSKLTWLVLMFLFPAQVSIMLLIAEKHIGYRRIETRLRELNNHSKGKIRQDTAVINNGSDLSVRLLDSNNNPIPNKDINITIKDLNGEDLSEVGITDKNGIRSMPIFYEAGEYTFVATFAGDSDYKDSSISQSFTIKDSVKSTKDTGSGSDNPYMGTFDGTWQEGVDYKGYCTTHGWVTLNSRHHCQWCEEEGKDPRVVRDSIQSYDHYLHYYDQIQIK